MYFCSRPRKVFLKLDLLEDFVSNLMIKRKIPFNYFGKLFLYYWVWCLQTSVFSSLFFIGCLKTCCKSVLLPKFALQRPGAEIWTWSILPWWSVFGQSPLWGKQACSSIGKQQHMFRRMTHLSVCNEISLGVHHVIEILTWSRA